MGKNMIYIAHRGLFEGPNKDKENRISQIKRALDIGLDCEIDVRYNEKTNEWYLGHDLAQEKIDFSFLLNYKLWIHCKNLSALHYLATNSMANNSGVKYFWHETDKFTLTSNNYIWTFPGNLLTNKSIAVLPEYNAEYWNFVKKSKCVGVCTDYVLRFKTQKEEQLFTMSL